MKQIKERGKGKRISHPTMDTHTLKAAARWCIIRDDFTSACRPVVVLVLERPTAVEPLDRHAITGSVRRCLESVTGDGFLEVAVPLSEAHPAVPHISRDTHWHAVAQDGHEGELLSGRRPIRRVHCSAGRLIQRE